MESIRCAACRPRADVDGAQWNDETKAFPRILQPGWTECLTEHEEICDAQRNSKVVPETRSIPSETVECAKLGLGTDRRGVWY